VGLSATQRPLEEVGRFLVGAGGTCGCIDLGHVRGLDLAIELPPSPLETVCSHEIWEEIYARLVAQIQAHRTLVFVNARRLAERLGARLGELLGASLVASHHGSLARERRLDAEQRLKRGELRALVATSSLELGIDVGEIDLVAQVGMTPSIAVFLQRIGRSGHALARTPKGRIFPLTPDELVAAAALLGEVRAQRLDRTPVPRAPLDILAQHLVAACVAQPWAEDELFALVTRASPYRDLPRADFDAVLAHADGRHALLHRDGIAGRPRAAARACPPHGRRRDPDTGDYRVVLDPEGTVVGSLNEDFAVSRREATCSSSATPRGGSCASRRASPGGRCARRSVDRPFWLGEGPGRTRELAEAVSSLRERAVDAGSVTRDTGVSDEAARQIAEYVEAGRRALGTVPTLRRLVAERFFDEAGGTQLVLHAPFGSRVNRALGLALRKRFCVGFGFELQAAADEEAIVFSLGPQHSFPLADVFDFLSPATARDVLVQALLAAPMFQARWRWNVSRALLPLRQGAAGPHAAQRMRSDDLLSQAFPAVLACPETLAPTESPTTIRSSARRSKTASPRPWTSTVPRGRRGSPTVASSASP
jgi:ATP-dependent Lhr-like helicase